MIRYSVEGPVHTLTLNRPDKLNALFGDMRAELLAGVEKADADRGCRVLVITGAGRAFCSGGDVETMRDMVSDPARIEPLLHAGAAVVRAIRRSRLPVVAAVNGVAAGAGLSLALACDMRIASEEATFSASFVKIGLHPDWGGTWLLPRLVGPGQAMRLMMTGSRLSAAEALAIGLVEQVVTAEELGGAVQELTRQLAQAPPALLASIKEAVYRGHDRDPDSTLAFEAQAQLQAFASPNAAEGLEALRVKRAPVFYMIRVERSDRVAVLWFENPPVNVLTMELIEALDRTVETLESDHTLDFLLLRGGGERGFSAGVDIQAHLPPRHAVMLRTFHTLLRRLYESRLISVAYADGLVLGGGLELALACDFGLVSASARVGQPEIEVGCYPPFSVLLLPRLVGEKRALDLLLLGRQITGTEAGDWGLFCRVVHSEDDLPAFLTLLQNRSVAVMREARRWARQSLVRGALSEVEESYLNNLVPLHDYREGLEAFLEKRPPVWRGR